QLARAARRNPRELATQLVDHIMAQPDAQALVASAEVAGPGFINFHLTSQAQQAVLQVIHKQAGNYGHQLPTGQKVMVEFVSANPTGPLHVGHARQAALGDSLCRLFATQGHTVTREFYYNDAGNQIEQLAISVQARAKGLSPDDPAFPADGYRGDYIADIANAYMNGETAQASDGQPVTATGDVTDLE